MSQLVRVFAIDGKDFLDIWEAAHYMCMSTSKFKELIRDDTVKPLNNHGKVVYRKIALTELIEEQNQKE